MLFGHCPFFIAHLFSTLKDILNHMQVHAAEFRRGFLQVHKRIDALDEKIDGVEDRLTEKIDGLEERLTAEMHGVDDLDLRVQDLEEQELPKRIKRIEKKLQLQA